MLSARNKHLFKASFRQNLNVSNAFPNIIGMDYTDCFGEESEDIGSVLDEIQRASDVLFKNISFLKNQVKDFLVLYLLDQNDKIRFAFRDIIDKTILGEVLMPNTFELCMDKYAIRTWVYKLLCDRIDPELQDLKSYFNNKDINSIISMTAEEFIQDLPKLVELQKDKRFNLFKNNLRVPEEHLKDQVHLIPVNYDKDYHNYNIVKVEKVNNDTAECKEIQSASKELKEKENLQCLKNSDKKKSLFYILPSWEINMYSNLKITHKSSLNNGSTRPKENKFSKNSHNCEELNYNPRFRDEKKDLIQTHEGDDPLRYKKYFCNGEPIT